MHIRVSGRDLRRHRERAQTLGGFVQVAAIGAQEPLDVRARAPTPSARGRVRQRAHRLGQRVHGDRVQVGHRARHQARRLVVRGHRGNPEDGKWPTAKEHEAPRADAGRRRGLELPRRPRAVTRPRPRCHGDARRARARASDAGEEEEPRRCPAGFALSDASLRRRRSAFCFRGAGGGSGPRKSAGPRQTFPTSPQIASLIALRSDKSFSGFRRLFDAGKKCTVTPCHAATPRRFTIFLCFRVSDAELAVFARSFSVRDAPTYLARHSRTRTTPPFTLKGTMAAFAATTPLPQGASPRTWAAAWRRAGPDAPRPVPIGAIALRNTREKKPYPLRSRPGTRARGRERRHDAETNVTARRALTFCPVDAITG